MIHSTSQLNEIVKNISKENTNSSVGQLFTIIETSKHSGIKFSFDEKYNASLSVFIKKNFPEFNLEKANQKIAYLSSENKYQEAATLRDEINAMNTAIHRKFRMEKYETEDWFIPKSESDIFFLPTQIAVIDNLIFGS